MRITGLQPVSKRRNSSIVTSFVSLDTIDQRAIWKKLFHVQSERVVDSDKCVVAMANRRETPSCVIRFKQRPDRPQFLRQIRRSQPLDGCAVYVFLKRLSSLFASC